MNKGLLLAAAAAVAFSGSVLAKGGGVRTGASADAYIDKNAQITANDCEMLTVESARSQCMRQAQGGAGMHGNVGATSGSGTGATGSIGSSDSGARAPMHQGRGEGSSSQRMHSGGSMGSPDSGARSPMHQGR
jgi:hypothetical protein